MGKIYAGIGARKTPAPYLELMTRIAEDLGPDWLLRTGGARGADSAFAAGALNKEIHLPWDGYNGLYADTHYGRYVPPCSPELLRITAMHHPAWDRLSETVRAFMCRNTSIILGADLKQYATMIICWTPGGKLVGGTSHAMRIGYHYDIPVFNIALEEDIVRLIAFEAKTRVSR